MADAQFKAIDIIMANHDFAMDDDKHETTPVDEEPVYSDAEKRDMEICMIQLLARKDLIHHELGKLDPGKKRDCKRIAAYNVELNMINDKIGQLERILGRRAMELDKGTRVGRFLGRMQRTFKQIGRSIKRFVKRNQELVETVLTIGIPLLIAGLIKAVL